MKKKISVKSLIIIFIVSALVLGSLPFIINGIIILSSQKYYISTEEAIEKGADCILVLGAGVVAENVPSKILEDRIKKGIELYELSASDRLLMSGDYGRKSYNEVSTMKNYAIDKGVPADMIFMDPAGFTTYESMYRAKEVFGVKKIIVVTQKYHLYRAIYTADKLGLEVYGVDSDLRDYKNPLYDNTREFLARCKAFVYCIIKPKPTYLGEPISIKGSGTQTDDLIFN